MMFISTKNNFPKDGSVNVKLGTLALFQPLRHWLNKIEIRRSAIAHLLCRIIPAQCPFERNIYWFGRQIAHLPPLCQINPCYEEVVSLRFRALCYLADCGEDIRCYC